MGFSTLVAGERLTERGPDTRVLFTTGNNNYNEQLISQKIFKPDIVVVDELHKWSITQEIQVSLARKAERRRRGYKYIFTSATLPEAEKLAAWLGNVPSYKVGQKRQYIATPRRSGRSQAEIIADMVKEGRVTLVVLLNRSAIKNRMSECEALLRQDGKRLGRDYDFVPLYSEMFLEEQDRAFRKFRKPTVVFATPIAAYGANIPNLSCVVSGGIQHVQRSSERCDHFLATDVMTDLETLQLKHRLGREKRVHVAGNPQRALTPLFFDLRPSKAHPWHQKQLEEREAHPEFFVPADMARLDPNQVVLELMSHRCDPRKE